MALNRFGPQPIREVIWRAGYSHQEFAEMSGVRPISHVRLALSGYCPPSAELRRAAARLLRVPIEQLFTSESLGTPHCPHRPHRPRSVGRPTPTPR